MQVDNIVMRLECEKRSIALENVQKIADALKVETYKLFVDELYMECNYDIKNQNGGS